MEWDANLYNEHSNYQFRIGQVAVAQLKPRDGERILEIGCGAGKLTALIAKQIPKGRITATDISQNMIEKARETVAQSGVTNVDFECIDAVAIQYDSEFDAIFSNATIHMIWRKKRLYERLYAALKPGGRMVLTAAFTPIQATRRGLEWAHFSNINLTIQDFECDAKELSLCIKAAIPDAFAETSSPEERERLLGKLRMTLASMLSEDTTQVDESHLRQSILFIAAEKRK